MGKASAVKMTHNATAFRFCKVQNKVSHERMV